ncbi:hypothetical protein [Fluviicola sp.]|uniref:hypothetical protein n=1 Tax=Fluviicola sp. TaxID=1917219 RepID=UPI003D2E96E2
MHPIPLSETDVHVLFKDQEDVFLFDKDSHAETWRISFDGEASIGFLGLVNEWAIVGGDRLLVWKNNELKFIEDPDLICIHDIRQIEDDVVEILTDPWGDQPAIWKFSIQTEKKEKVREFNEYKEKEYAEKVDW